jgi:DNA-binding MarR family transcriptional regulator
MQTSGRTKSTSRAKAPGRNRSNARADDVVSDASIAFMLLSTANFWRRSGNAYYRGLFSISITEVAILNLLEAHAPLTLNAIADHCGVDKTQMSRSVKELVARKLVRQNRSPRHGSELEISLDKEGQRLCQRLKPATAARFATLQASLTPQEVDTLKDLLGRLFASAKATGQKESSSRRTRR